MAITKSQLLTAVNGNLEREEEDIDAQINRVLFKVSNKDIFLSKIDDSNTIDNTTTTVTLPSDFKRLNTIILVDDNRAVRTDSLIEISYEEYLSANFRNNLSTPYQYAVNNRTLHFFPIPPVEYKVEINYFYIHAPTPDSIEFDDRFLSVLESGATYETAFKFGLTQQIQMWGQRYADDLNDISNYAIKPIKTVQFKRF
jgi:hypothetical protein